MIGWECPKCGRCYSPTMPHCYACPMQSISTAGTNAWPIFPGLINTTGTNVGCQHEFEMNSTMPSCRKCGQQMNQPQQVTIT